MSVGLRMMIFIAANKILYETFNHPKKIVSLNFNY